MAGVSLPLAPQRSFGNTSRTDRWWVQPILVFTGLGLFVIYSTWAAFQGKNFEFGPYLSPMYSPVLWGNSEHAWFGDGKGPPSWYPTWLPSWASYSPAFLILWAPAGFRLTCYYYRGAYYKAFWADPPNCAVGEPRKGYIGESNWPLMIMNIHRFFFYLAALFILMLTIDAIQAFRFKVGDHHEFGIGVGTVILCANAVLLGGYTFGCHSFRHLVGGRKDCISESPLCLKAYNACSALNGRHMLWAWMSLIVVGFSDLYIRLCAMDKLHDYRIIFG
jgi:hypothetical protein